MSIWIEMEKKIYYGFYIPKWFLPFSLVFAFQSHEEMRIVREVVQAKKEGSKRLERNVHNCFMDGEESLSEERDVGN